LQIGELFLGKYLIVDIITYTKIYAQGLQGQKNTVFNLSLNLGESSHKNRHNQSEVDFIEEFRQIKETEGEGIEQQRKVNNLNTEVSSVKLKTLNKVQEMFTDNQ
jgi:hypothetical protein